ncbi:MAG: hypothetical protein JWN23_1112 [Rhodocyclales bacterium]|nr:hypothetical protein [Rhodocyclales bacterium]
MRVQCTLILVRRSCERSSSLLLQPYLSVYAGSLRAFNRGMIRPVACAFASGR